MNRTLARYIAGLVVLLTLTACGAAGQPTGQASPPAATPPAQTDASAPGTPKIGAGDTLLTIRTEGGHCVYGLCWSQKQIRADGTYQAADGTGMKTNGTLEEAQVAELTQLIAATDFAQLAAQPFTGTCPIAYDGQELIYTFYTLSGEHTLASCKVAIDENSTLFKHIAGLVEVIDQE